MTPALDFDYDAGKIVALSRQRGGIVEIQTARRPGTVATIIQMANPVFIVVAVCLPIGALVAAQISGVPVLVNYVHVMTGVLWTGIDLFMGFVLGPVLGMMEPRERVAVFKRLIPRMTFLMPVLAGVTSTAGIQLAQQMGSFSLDRPWTVAALVIVAVLTVQGFGVLLPNEIRIFQQLLSPTPDTEKVSLLGMRNARLGGIQGVLQLAIIFVMAMMAFNR